MSNPTKKRTIDSFFKPPPKKVKVEDEASSINQDVKQPEKDEVSFF